MSERGERIVRLPSRRRVGWSLRLGLAVVLGSLASPGLAAKLVSVSGSEEPGFGRIVLTFDTPVAVKARTSGATLIMSFAQSVTMAGDKLVADLPRYVSVARRDPDGTGLRAALQGLYRVNVLEAGEKTFVDLLPPDWAGLPPALPPDVVADLARRAREAEARLRREEEARNPPPPVLALRIARLPTLLRLALPVPTQVEARLSGTAGLVSLHLDKPFRLDEGEVRGQLDPTVEGMSAAATADGFDLSLKLAEGFEARGFRDDDGYVIDISRSASEIPPKSIAGRKSVDIMKLHEAKPGEGKAGEGKTGEGKTGEAKTGEGKTGEAKAATAKVAGGKGAEAPSAHGPSAAGEASAAPARAPAAEAASEADAAPDAGPDRVVRAAVSANGATTRLVFPFSAQTAAALFETGGIATLVFETGARIELPPMPADGPVRPLGPPTRQGSFQVARFALPETRLLQLAPMAGGWTMTVGEVRPVAAGTLVAKRGRDERGQPSVSVALPRPGGALWLDGDPVRIAVVTAFGPGAIGVAKRQRFVDFEVLPSAQGVAVLAGADDLLVRPSLDGVAIGREIGLTLSPPASTAAEPDAAAAIDVDTAVDREIWATAQAGDVRGRIDAAVQALAAAPYAARGAARLDLAHLMIAARYEAEAAGALAYAEREDPTLPTLRRYLLLKGIAAARLQRDAEALRTLTAGPVASDPEARVWRAMLDARVGRWGPALSVLANADAVLSRYPDDLRADFALVTAQAAIETLDLARAETAVETATPLVYDAISRDRLALLRARLDGAAGRSHEALDTLRRLADAAERPVAAEAELRWVELALMAGDIDRDAALARLERLAVSWRGDGIEARTIVRLARLYAEAGRWREAFSAARVADRTYPDHELSRELHNEMMRAFEDIFLTERGADIPKLAFLALYFDFKEFSPPGRRGDDIVRRLADRLVELDLLDSAANLLQHQVDHRLVGAARSAVAARLAAIRLADGKPLKALEVLQATRLAELPAETKRARMLLEARALSDLSRTDLALDIIADEAAPDANRLRADILWTARRWRDAGEAHESLAGDRWRSGGPLTDGERADVIRAAIGLALAGDLLGLDRVRAKFSAKMSDSVDARTFALVSAPNTAGSGAFRELARRAATADTLGAFLRDYRKRYPDIAPPERRPAAEGASAPAPAPTPAGGPQAAAEGAPPPG